jgi:hypothetical protein
VALLVLQGEVANIAYCPGSGLEIISLWVGHAGGNAAFSLLFSAGMASANWSKALEL